MKTAELEIQWRDWGRKLGYPECCIEAFIKEEQHHFNIFTGTGFLPCKDCNKKDPREVLKYIDSHRQIGLPFPFCERVQLQDKRTLIRNKFIQNMRDSL